MKLLKLELIVENQYGVLNRITGLYARRGFNIESLKVKPTDEPAISKMTIVSEADEKSKNKIINQLEKLYDVISVTQIEGKK